MSASLIASENPATLHPKARRPYHGSCHCGHIKYIAYLTLPSDSFKPAKQITDTSSIYKCSCGTCRKMGLFHIRPINPAADFQLLSPLNPLDGGLSDYLCYAKKCHWLFCGICGVRCFATTGKGEIRTEDVGGEKKEVWGIRESDKGWEENDSVYLTINAVTLEPGQEALDLREWTEKGWIEYPGEGDDGAGEWVNPQMGRPATGNMY